MKTKLYDLTGDQEFSIEVFQFSLMRVMKHSVGLILVYCLISLTFHIREDFNRVSANEFNLLQRKISLCREEYFKNECEPATRREALEGFCREQEDCMLTDPQLTVTSIRIASSLIVELIKSFVEPLSLKALGFVAFCIASLSYVLAHRLKKSPKAIF